MGNSKITISGKPVDDAKVSAVLEAVIQDEWFDKLHNGDLDFTEEELAAILDISGDSSIDENDLEIHDRDYAITLSQFEILAREYVTRFPLRASWVNARWNPFRTLTFEETQKVQQVFGETPDHLHERLREWATNSISAIREPTRIITPSWLIVDASRILNIEGAVLVSTSTCVHELPARIFVGTRKPGWVKKLNDGGYIYTLYDLGRELTPSEKNTLYDAMRVGK